MFEKKKDCAFDREISNAKAFGVFLDIRLLEWSLKVKAPIVMEPSTIPVGKSYFWQVARQQSLFPLQTYNY